MRALLILSASFVLAAEPDVKSINPPGASRGAEIDVTFNGDRLEDGQGLLLYGPGITVKKVHDAKERGKRMTLAIAPDCPLGIHPMRLRTASGVSQMLLFSVGSMAEMPEKEPNNTPETAQRVELDMTITGTNQAEEVDVYVVEARKGERLTAEIEGMRLGKREYDPYVAILDANLKELATSDDETIVRIDALASIVAPHDGKYYIVVRDSTFNAPSNAQYRLHLGRYPQQRAVFPLGGKPGEKMKVHVIGDVAGDFEMDVTLPKTAGATFAVHAEDQYGIAPTGTPFRVSTLDNLSEREPNDEHAQANAFSGPMALNGVISKPGDVDCYKLTAKKGEQYDVRVYARSSRSPLDAMLTVYNSKGGGVASSDDAGASPDGALRLNIPSDGDYTIAIKDMLATQGSKAHVYRIEVTEVKPEITATLPEQRRYTDVVAVVPQDNRMAVMVNINRRDCNGDVVLDLPELPEGVEAEVVPVGANQSTTPLLLKASKKAPLAGAPTPIVPKLVKADKQAFGHFDQESLIIRVFNNRKLLTFSANGMAMVVTEPVPFKLEIIEPKVPLVRNGSMELKVRAIRDKGFQGPIRMRMAYNPTGVGSSGAVTIAEGKDEGVMPLTAGKDAETGDWKIVIIGSASGESGTLEAASQLATLKIAESFFNFTAKPAAVEQGKQGELAIEIEQVTDFPGRARLELVGLPNEAKAEPVEFDKSAEKVVVKVSATGKTPIGRHKAIMIRATATEHGEPITHIQGPIELRVDAPIAKKGGATDSKKADAAKTEPKKK